MPALIHIIVREMAEKTAPHREEPLVFLST